MAYTWGIVVIIGTLAIPVELAVSPVPLHPAVYPWQNPGSAAFLWAQAGMGQATHTGQAKYPGKVPQAGQVTTISPMDYALRMLYAAQKKPTQSLYSQGYVKTTKPVTSTQPMNPKRYVTPASPVSPVRILPYPCTTMKCFHETDCRIVQKSCFPHPCKPTSSAQCVGEVGPANPKNLCRTQAVGDPAVEGGEFQELVCGGITGFKCPLGTKCVTPKNKPGASGVCCFNAKIKPGVCPESCSSSKKCVSDCMNDSDCPTNEKCCKSGKCNKCTAPKSFHHALVSNPGTCPPIRESSPCPRVPNCQGDEDCGKKAKCCCLSDNCRVCIATGATLRKVGSCPKPTSIAYCPPLPGCLYDKTCPGNYKCCPYNVYGCRICQKAVPVPK